MGCFSYTLLNRIGAAETLRLLEHRVIRVLFDRESLAASNIDGARSLTRVRKKDPIDYFDRLLPSSGPNIADADRNRLLQYLDNAKIEFSEQELGDLLQREIRNDLKNGALRESLGFETNAIDSILPKDSMVLLRIARVAQGFILQNKLNLECICQDGFSKQYMNLKLGSLAPNPHDSIEPFSGILGLKGIPDFYLLYKKQVVALEDILAIRESPLGGIFRKWYELTDYDKDEILRLLIDKSSKPISQRLVRWIYPSVAGLIHPVSGVVVSAIDSFIVQKILDGWSPALFLDDVLRKRIDDRVLVHKRVEESKIIRQRFGKIGRNDKCPCQSGKKFKNCHGS